MKRAPKMKTYEAKDGWRWKLVGANGKIVSSSNEVFLNKFNAQRAAKNVLEIARRARFVVDA